MLVSRLFPPSSPQRLAPLPRWATTTRPPANSGRNPTQFPRDEREGEAVEAVALHALVEQRAGQGVAAHEVGVGAVEGGVEGGGLPQVGPDVPYGTDEANALGLVQGGQRHERLDRRERVVRDRHGPVETVAAMDHPVPDGRQVGRARMPEDPVQRLVHRVVQVVRRLGLQRNVGVPAVAFDAEGQA